MNLSMNLIIYSTVISVLILITLLITKRVIKNTIFGIWEYEWEDPFKDHSVRERIRFHFNGHFKICYKEVYYGETAKGYDRGVYKYDKTTKTIRLIYSGSKRSVHSDLQEETWHDVKIHSNHLIFNDRNAQEWIYKRNF